MISGVFFSFLFSFSLRSKGEGRGVVAGTLNSGLSKPHVQSWNRITQFCQLPKDNSSFHLQFKHNSYLFFFLKIIFFSFFPFFLALYNWSAPPDSGTKFLQILGWEKIINKGNSENNWEDELKREFKEVKCHYSFMNKIELITHTSQ